MRITSCRWHLYLPGGCPADKAAEREGIDTGTTGARQGKAVKTKELRETEKRQRKKEETEGKEKAEEGSKKETRAVRRGRASRKKQQN